MVELPAIGGVPVRYHRDAAIIKNSFKLTKTYDRMSMRPIASFYHQNFMTEQHRRNSREHRFPGYENYIDRRGISGAWI